MKFKLSKVKKRSELGRLLKSFKRIETKSRRVMPKQKPHRSEQSVGTPKDFFDALEKKFGPMVWDLAASKKNTKRVNFITEQQDTFKIDWSKLKGNLYLNPPFGNIARFVKYCVKMADKGAHIFVLIPASVGSNWYRDYVWPYAYVWFLNGRIKFDGHAQGYPKDCMLVEFGGNKRHNRYAAKDGGHAIWRYKTGEVY